VTKAELFHYLAERAGPKRPRTIARDESRRSAGERNLSSRAGKKAQYAYEPTAGRPSRKSSRKAANRQKNDVQSRMKRQWREVRPEDRPRPR